jgi:hypothetical protein
MKIQPRYYPLILIAVYVVFVVIGFLLGFLPERGAEQHGRAVPLLLARLSQGGLL